MSDDFLALNGIDAVTGDYLLKLTEADIVKIAKGEEWDVNQDPLLYALNKRNYDEENPSMAPEAGVDGTNLAEAGWGIIFAHNENPAILDALKELIEHRQVQAGDLFKQFSGDNGYFPPQDAAEFLSQYKATPHDPVDPTKVPYYLLIVGSPETISYGFQYELDVQYAVGRIYFETVEEYAQYAHSVVQAETQKLALPRQVRFFGVQNENDQATQLSAESLVKPLSIAEKLKKLPNWDLQTDLAAQATKARLGELMGGKDTPALLFTASHGLGFPNGDNRQFSQQGALICQDWPGRGSGPLKEDYYFSAQDIAPDAKLWGLISFHFACYGAGTPKVDEFGHRNNKWPDIAPRSFVARLPQRLLSHPKGGALAVIGHVERAWGSSFTGAGDAQISSFRSTLLELMKDKPIGLAMEYFNSRYAALSTQLTNKIYNLKLGNKIPDFEISSSWTANNDARSYTIIGDPAVRLMVSPTQIDAVRPVCPP
jgi:hypothetical protein